MLHHARKLNYSHYPYHAYPETDLKLAPCGTPDRDNQVVNQTGKRGWFNSDRSLNSNGAATASLMQQFAVNPSAFLAAWCTSWQESSLLGVDTTAAGFTFLDGWNPTTIAIPSPSPPPQSPPPPPQTPPSPPPKQQRG